MSVNNAALQNNPDENAYSVPLFYNYSYDQLNRIKNMTAFSGLNTEDNGWLNPETNDDYSESVSYDPNGNITDYDRNGSIHVAPDRAMDNLHYDYIPGTNKLLHVSDLPGNDGNYPDDIDNQEASENYVYDQIGNLIHDESQSHDHSITWTVYGKIASIFKNDQTISFTYDAAGNRITKTAEGKTTVYVRDASGNVMSIYERLEEDAFRQVEIPVYGSSRIGLARRGASFSTTEYLDGGFNQATISTFTRGAKIFELTNHLGNVLATITDRKLQNTFDESTVGYYTADVVGAQDYYPGGMLMPGRHFNNSSYRYGFNGKENDNEVKGEGNQQDYGLRIYDPRLMRFLSVDPLADYYPYYTPYQFAGNSPISNIDLDGAEPKPSITGKEQEGQQQTTSETKYAPSDCNCAESEGYQVYQTWNYHSGGLGTGKYTDPNNLNSEIKTQAGWYSSDDYFNVLSGTTAAKQLAVDAGYSHWVNPGMGAKESLSNFIGNGLNDNAAKYLNAAAWKIGSHANFMASGYTEPSSFNVEDILVVGLLAKEGIKILGGVAAKSMGMAEGKQLLLQAPEIIHRHHVLPQEFKGWFSNRGIKSIDDFTVEISSQAHLRGVHGKGLGNMPGQWNKKWSDFIKTNPNASPSEIFHQAEGMLKQYGLEHLPYIPYKK